MKARVALILTLLCTLHAATKVRAQCAQWRAGPLDNGNAPNGANGAIGAAITWDPDGAGPLAPRLVVGGQFTSIGGVAANHIAQFNPESAQWEPFGSGIATDVGALTVFNGQVVAGCLGDNNVGTFDSTVRRWNGSSWESLSATNTGSVTELAVYNGELYIGGNFMTHFVPSSSNDAFYIAKWNSTANLWEAVELAGFGSQTNTAVSALAVYNGDLYVGGYIKAATITGSALRISHGNAGGWTAITDGTDPGGIYDFAVFSGLLIAVGGFNTINGVAYNNIASWDGAFHTYTSGTSGSPYGGTIFTITVYNGLVIGGVFNSASGHFANHVAFLPPGTSTWLPLGGGTDDTVYGAVSYGGQLVAVGTFTYADGPANHIAHWDGYEWGPFGGGSGNYVLAMTNFNGRLVAGGDFHQSADALTTANSIAGWSGGTVQPFGVGVDGPVRALKAFKYPGIHGSNELVAGGSFIHAGGIAASSIARWDESLLAFPPPAWQPMGAGFNGEVYAIERFNGDTYAGGLFGYSGATQVNDIARWNETTDAWEPLGSGMTGGYVQALKEYNGYLYAGGSFTSAGGVSTGGLARWNGSSWSQVGGFFLGNVYALEVYNGRLVIGGEYPGINSSPDLAQYDGLFYYTFSTGGTNSPVRALVANGTRLYVGGQFGSIGGVPVNRIGYWDGSWHDTHYGTNNNVYALGAYNNEVEVGGVFSLVDYGGPAPLTSPFWGRYSETGVPWFAQQPFSKTALLGDNVSFTAQIASGFSGLTYRWYHNDVPMSDGPTGNGSTIGGATTTTLTISNAVWNDHGGYRLVAASSCGAVSSFPATLDFTGVTAAPSPGSVRTTVFEALGPNPAGGASQLSFSLAHDAAVGVRIYDVAGRLVRRIDVGRLPAGHHLTSWDARDNNGQTVSAAPYFVRLDVDGQAIGLKRLTIVH
jgi:hypothetical protein